MSTSDSFIRVEILGQTDLSSAVTIDRAMAPKLAATYSASDWNVFCEKVDKVLEPALAIKKRTRRMQLIGLAFAILPSVAFGIFSLFDIFFDLGIVIPIFFIIPAGLYCYTYKTMMRDISALKDELREVVNEESNKRSDVSFHLKDEVNTNARIDKGYVSRTAPKINYIECVIESYSAAVPMGGDVWNTIAPVLSEFTGTKTTAERLQELDAAKPYMSEDEYNQKKAAILAAL